MDKVHAILGSRLHEPLIKHASRCVSLLRLQVLLFSREPAGRLVELCLPLML